jgi:hypothetical protein
MNSRDLKLKRYLGDGVYAGYEPATGCVWLWTSNGVVEHHWIGLERGVRIAVSLYFRDFVETDKAIVASLPEQI